MGDIGPTRVRNYLLEESLAPSEADVRLAVGAVEDPDLRRGIGELGMIGRVEANRRGVTVEILVPAQGWPGAHELADRVGAELSARGPEELGRIPRWTCG